MLPMTVMSDFLGVEPTRRDEFRVWTLTRISGMFDPKLSGTPQFAESTERLRGYFSERLTLAEREPVGGLMDRLVQSGTLSHDEMVDLLIIMLGAGIITTADLIGISSTAAAARSETPAQAISASSSMSPEQSSRPVPPAFGWIPATATPRPVSTLHVTAGSLAVPLAFKVSKAALASLL